MRRFPLVLPLVAAAVVAAPRASADTKPGLQARAQQVLAQVNDLGRRIEVLAESYDLAGVKLGRTRASLRANASALRTSRRNLTRAQRALARLLVLKYEQGETNSPLAVALGSTSLTDLIDRLDAIKRIAAQDKQVLAQVKEYQGRVLAERQRLRQEQANEQTYLRTLASRRTQIEGQLRERQQLLGSIRSEIARLQAQERARQAQLRREAEARLAREEAQARLRLAQEEAQARLARERAAAEARRARSAPKAAQPATTTATDSTPAEQATTDSRTTTAQTTTGASPPPPAATASTTTSAPAAGPPPTRHADVASIVMRYLGIPYKWGGYSPATGFDCSGLVMYVYEQVGISLPHNAALQYGYGAAVPRSDLQPGDLVFFNGLGHVGIYIGGGQFVDAPQTGDVVKIENLNDSWWSSAYVGARRLP